MQLPLRLVLQPSRSLAAVLAGLTFAALGGLAPLDLPLWFKLAGGATVLAVGMSGLRRHGLLLASSSVRQLVLREDGSLEGESRDRGRFEAVASPQSTVFPWLVVMLLEVPGTRRPLPVVVLPDSLGCEEWRHLRSWLRWCAGRVSGG